MPVSETMESQQEKKEKMKVLSEHTAFTTDEVETLMKCTYYSQQNDMDKGTRYNNFWRSGLFHSKRKA